MNHSWWSAGIDCPTCHGVTALIGACYSSDGELMFNFFCMKCKEKLQWKVYASSLADLAHEKDLEKHLKKYFQLPTVPAPLQPPLAIAPPVLNHEPTLRDDDIRWSEADLIEGRGLGITM